MAAPLEQSASADKCSILTHTAQSCIYTSCYCEENIWKLCESIREKYGNSFERCHVVFLSNDQRAIPLWKQRNAKSEGRPVLWDYHVILLYNEDTCCWVFDLDTSLPFPCEFEVYVREVLGTEVYIRRDFWRMFRVITAAEYIEYFASDRRHMLKPDGTWMAEPPEYPPIATKESSHNIDSWISMDVTSGWGQVMDLKTLCSEFSNAKETFGNLPNLL